ncbi:MAG: hypothetical protein LUH21_04005 [Clostridiales bacterium]|nr:hypothetical protein [Clostridiales bacterium]
MVDTSTNDILHKEIDLIQGCINRMSSNSFMCKGWLLSLIIAILALLPENINRKSICFVILLANMCFWWLDTYFLQQEKLFRWKYEWIIKNRIRGNMDFLYDLNPNNQQMWENHNIQEANLFKLMLLNKCITPMYGGIALVSIFMIIFR